ncbi:hypothetical protein ABEB36_002485 [Hypothenemus hampei]|uniref:Phosphatidylinositol-glycan biosynthesis class W protein n=1 Tax=Hypothenemus hampei TaxID=57062 RepID=A0ABD1F5W9_HYPHA
MEADITENSDNFHDALETLLLVVPTSFLTTIATFLTSLFFISHKRIALIVEFIILVIPNILIQTVWSEYVTDPIAIFYFLTSFTCITFFAYFCSWWRRPILPTRLTYSIKKDFITNCRSTVNLLSVIAILAVDFLIFPRHHSKTHKTGFSLMDVGVGLFVFANGIVAPQTRKVVDVRSKTIKGFVVLLILGFARLLLTKLINYSVSEIEYGVHWNFFFTLAFTKIICYYILHYIHIDHIFITACLITVVHETLIQLFFKRWVFDVHHRENLLDANKEGLVSTFGYVALYLFSICFNLTIRYRDRKFLITMRRFFFCTLFALTLTVYCNYHFNVSRRLANAGYVFWILFIGSLMSWLFFIAERGTRKMFHEKLKNYICVPHLYDAINFNGLIFFLVGNVLTGLVNKSVKTKLVNSVNSIWILTGYMFVNCFVVVVLKWKNMKIPT